MINSIKFLLICLFTLSISSTYAQMPGGGANRGQMGGQNMNMGHFYGKIIDSANNKPIEAVSVQLIQNKFDTVTKKRKDVVAGGMLTSKKGEFSIENVNIMAQYKLKITAIGFKPYEAKVAFQLNMGGAKSGDMSSMLSAVDKDLGNIKLETDARQLQDVTVSASKAQFEMKIDRKVFNVEKNLNSIGGTAVDIMKNVPSVNVDIDGNVSLRNATPQIFVDGRPTTMTLDQIPADAIASVEIITNPSAKYDASGGAGILNIVLKKNRKAGYNGNIRAGIDMRGRPSVGGDINLKQQKVNFFAAGQFGMRKSISTVKTDRTDFIFDTTAYLKQRNKPVNSGFFAFGRMGMDYFIDNRNTLTVGGNIVRGQFKTDDIINTYRDTVKPLVTTSDRGERKSNSIGNFYNYGATMSFKHNFAKASKEWTADLNYNYSKNNNVGDYNTQYFYTNNSAKTGLITERSKGGGTTQFFTVQTDFVNPINDKMKIETGLRGSFRNFTSFNDNYVRDFSGQYLLIARLSNNYKFDDALYAGYLTFSHQLKKLSYQIGLRAESSSYTGNLITKNQKFKTDYPLSFFPSAFVTYKVNDKVDVQLNYSRKINRPNFFQLIPFIDYSDSLNLSVGNPALVPEFTNLLELSYSNQYKVGHSFLATAYFRHTDNLITRYQYRTTNPDTTKTGSVIMNTYANANSSYTVGFELTGKNKLAKWWDLTTNVNLFNSTIKAGNLLGSVNSSLFSWFAKINNNFKLPKNFSIQLSGDYTAKTLVSPNSGGGGNRGGMGGGMMFGGGSQPSSQGYIKPVFGADFSIRKDFLKNNAASLTLQFSDIFRTKIYATHAEAASFVQDNERRRDPQFVRLNFNWLFGKIDVSLFKKKNMKGEMENMQNAQQGMGN